ncbi:MAG: hypothetical protein R3Y11_02550 [Pseudomonadota bacterium]
MQNRTQCMLALLIVLLVAFFALDTPELYKNLFSGKKELTEQEQYELFVAQQRQKKEEKPKEKKIDSSAASLQKKIQKQAEVDAMLLAELQSGAYTFEEPFVFVDPYNQSPLSAIALFYNRRAYANFYPYCRRP